jgi:SPP1 family predicted phage head-tail adaptor
MPEPSLAFQKALRARLIASPDLAALLPPDNIIDATNRPERFPCVKIGEGQTSFAVPYTRYHDKATLDVHVWCEEAGLSTAKEIIGAITTAIRGQFPDTADYRFFSVIATNALPARPFRPAFARRAHDRKLDAGDRVMKAGKLDRQFTIERATQTIDDAGTPVQTWAPLLRAWGKLVANATGDSDQASCSRTTRTVKFEARFIAGITLDDRLRYEGRQYILRDLEEIGRRIGLKIKAERIGP